MNAVIYQNQFENFKSDITSKISYNVSPIKIIFDLCIYITSFLTIRLKYFKYQLTIIYQKNIKR